MANYKTSKTSKTNKPIWYAIVTLILALAIVLVCSIGSTGFTNGDIKTWFNSWGSGTTEKEPVIVAYTDEGEPMYSNCSYAMPTSMTYAVSPEVYASSGEITVTATTSNTLIRGKYDWSVEFLNPDDAWIKGSTATAFVQVAPAADGSDTAVIKYLKCFGTPILVKATLRDGNNESASCTFNCLKDFTLRNVSTKGFCCDFGDWLGLSGSVEWGVGTVEGDFTLNSVKIAVDEGFKSTFQRYLKFDVVFKDFSINDSTYNVELGGATYGLEVETHTEVTYSMFIENFDDYNEDNKEAIYYAWFQAYKDFGEYNSNVLLDTSFTYSFMGVTVRNFVESDLIGSYLNGDAYGCDVQPSVNLNGSYVFG